MRRAEGPRAVLRPRPTLSDAALLGRIEGQLRRALARAGWRIRTPAFDVFIWPDGDLFYRNRAVPVSPPPAWDAAIDAMVGAFGAAGRTPRTEYLMERWPDLEDALASRGFVTEMRAAVFVATAPPPRPPGGGAARILDRDDPELGPLLEAARTVFGTPATDDAAELLEARRDVARGSTIAALLRDGDRIVAGAALIGVDEEAELAAVWTLPEHRRRGHATAVCRTLLARFFEGGGRLVWLSAADASAERLYESLGFVRVATQLNHALP